MGHRHPYVDIVYLGVERNVRSAGTIAERNLQYHCQMKQALVEI